MVDSNLRELSFALGYCSELLNMLNVRLNAVLSIVVLSASHFSLSQSPVLMFAFSGQ